VLAGRDVGRGRSSAHLEDDPGGQVAAA
jgi:hypothetical protein